MRSVEEQAAWKANFLAAMKPVHDSIAGRPSHREPETPALSAAPTPAPPPPPPPSPPPIVFAPPTERETRRAEKAAVTMILDAYASFEPADRATSRTPQRGSGAEEAAADLILSFMPNRRS